MGIPRVVQVFLVALALFSETATAQTATVTYGTPTTTRFVAPSSTGSKSTGLSSIDLDRLCTTTDKHKLSAFASCVTSVESAVAKSCTPRPSVGPKCACDYLSSISSLCFPQVCSSEVGESVLYFRGCITSLPSGSASGLGPGSGFRLPSGSAARTTSTTGVATSFRTSGTGGAQANPTSSALADGLSIPVAGAALAAGVLGVVAVLV